MKKSNYLWLALVAFVFYCCSSDSIIPEEESVSVSTEAKTNENTTLELETNATNLPVTGNNKIPSINNPNSFRTDEFTPDGVINGGCFEENITIPLSVRRIGVTFVNGLSEGQKMTIRCTFHSYGQLFYYTTCENNNNKEIWYFKYNPNLTEPCNTNPYILCIPSPNSGDGNIPIDLPDNFSRVAFSTDTSCTD